MTVLPVRPAPRPSEPLSSYAARLADANGLTRSRVLLPWRHDIDIPRRELDVVAALAGLGDDAARRLTMNRYPLAIRGHGPQRRHGWRHHHSVIWICPSCTPTTGHTDLLWQTALMPVCLRCGCYLVRAGAPLVARPADPNVLGLAALLGELAEASIPDLRPRQRLYRLRRRCATLAATIDDDHPDGDGHLLPVDVAAARAWGAYPAPDPGTVATLLVLAARRMVRRHTAAQPRRQSAEFTPADGDRLSWFLTRIRHHVARDGLQPGHVPTMLPTPATEAPRRPGQWLSPARAAVALWILISQALDQDATPDAALDALGVTGIPGSLLIDGVYTGEGLRERDAHLLGAALDDLLGAGLVDYQRRRDTLRPVTRLPMITVVPRPSAGTRDHTVDELALGWIWTRLTHGPMRSSRWPHIPDRDVHAFDAAIDPETRLGLLEIGQQLLADADLVTIPTPATTWTTVTRRSG